VQCATITVSIYSITHDGGGGDGGVAALGKRDLSPVNQCKPLLMCGE
jgi:hypothetical protein